MTASFAHKAAGSAVAWMAATVAPFVIAALVFRRMGEGPYGVWATVLALRGLLVLFDGGLTLGVSRDAALLASEGRPAWARIRAAWRLHLGIAIAIAVLGLLAAGMPEALLGADAASATGARLVTTLTACEAATASLFAPLFAILRGRERFGALAAATTLQSVLGIGLVLLLLGTHGLPGAAAALLLARIAVQGSLFAWMRSRRLLDRPDGPGDARPDLRAMFAFALPLWVMTLGTWLGQMADVPLIGALFGDEAAGHADLGSRFAAACSGLLFAVLAVAYPGFVTVQPGQRAERMSAVLFLACTLAAAGFGFVIAGAAPILTAWVGSAPPLSVSVLTLYSLVWLVNAPVHVLASAVIANAQHRVLYRTTAIGLPVNAALGIALALGGLPQGPALASLATIVLTDWLLFPLLTLRGLGLRQVDWIRPAFGGYLAGGAIAAVAATAMATATAATTALAIGVAVTLLGCAVVLDLTVRQRSTLRLWWRRARRGGFAVMRRQRRQCREVKARLTATPRPPCSPTDRPLVTVRIATYNRGRLVAERALASAIAQTYDHLEIVVVGDCCDEATAAAVRSVQDPRIRFLNLPERGRYPSDPELRWMVAGSTPMNHGVEISRGEWIAPLDDDDEFTPDHVEVMLNACLARDLDFAWGIAESEHQDGSWSRQGSWPLRRGAICHSAVFYSRRIADIRHDLDAWRLDDPGDWNLWSRFRRAGAVMGFVDRVVARHYVERRGIAARRPLWMAKPRAPEPAGSTP